MMQVCPSCRTIKPARTKCQKCQPVQQRAYDERRGSRQERGYDAEWYRFRNWLIATYDLAFCGDRPPQAPPTTDSQCQREGRLTPGDDMDHIAAITGRTDRRRLDPANCQWLCDRAPNYCHSRKRGREAHHGGAG